MLRENCTCNTIYSYSSNAWAGEEIDLEGWEAFDAAVHCAAICAGQRMASVLNHASGPQDTVTAAQQRVDVQHGGFLQLQTQSQAGWTPSVRERLMTTM